MSVAQYLRKYGDLPIREILVITSPYARPSAPRAYQRKKLSEQVWQLAKQTQLEIILAGSRLATRVL